jgi:hypothetical protein
MEKEKRGEGKTKKKKSEVEIQEEDQREDFGLEVAPCEFLTTLEDVSRIMSQNKGTIRSVKCL